LEREYKRFFPEEVKNAQAKSKRDTEPDIARTLATFAAAKPGQTDTETNMTRIIVLKHMGLYIGIASILIGVVVAWRYFRRRKQK
jgi:hypothetical protein